MNSQANRPTWIEIDAAALRSNIAQLRRIIAPDVMLMAVVKANAYGHGAADVAPIIAAHVDRFAVAALSEAIELRRAGITRPILVLGYTPAWLAHDAAHLDIHLAVYDAANAQDIAAVAAQSDRPITVHLKVNTGMNRLGVNVADAPALLADLRGMPGLVVEGIFTHFATSDLADKHDAAQQFDRFAALLADLRAAGLCPPVAHAANSAAVLTMPQTHLTMVRSGIAIYGLDPDVDDTPLPPGFTPALTWKALIAQVRALAPGDAVSYGREFVADRPMTAAVLPIGYADGFPRRPLTWGSVLVRGRVAPILGRVCMDQTIVDVTDIVAATGPLAMGEEAVLIGTQGDAELSAAEAARRTGTINYDVTSRILARVPRIVTNRIQE
jgi:alanine racemase